MAEQDFALQEASKIIRLSADLGHTTLERSAQPLRRRLSLRALPEDMAPEDLALEELAPLDLADVDDTDPDLAAPPIPSLRGSTLNDAPVDKPPLSGALNRERSTRRLIARQLGWMIALTTATTAAALAAMVFCGLQWWEIHAGDARADRQAAERLAASAQIQANAARDAVVVAQQQAMISRDMLALSQKTADAQAKTAAAAEAATAPLLETQQLDLSGLRGAPDRHGKVRLNLHYRFGDTGRATAYLKAVSTALYIGESLPPVPAYDPAIPSNMELPTGSAVMNATSVTFDRGAGEIKDVIAGRKTAFVVGYLDYLDAANAAHRLCFAYALDFKGQDMNQSFAPAGSGAYRCGGG